MDTITKRIDRITDIAGQYRGTVLPAPKSVKIELTDRCNYSCGFCVHRLQRGGKSEMDRAQYSRIIREMKDAGVEELGMFYIGESFLLSWLPEAIAEARGIGFEYIFLTTNGSVASPSRVEACMRAGLSSLKFSLNFADEKQFKEVAGVTPRLYEQAIRNIAEARRIRDAGGHACRLYASSIRFDGEQGDRMDALVDMVRPLVDEHYWLPLYGMSGASAEFGWKPQPGNPGRLDAMREPLPCWSVFTEGHVTVDLKLSACCFGDDGGAFAMADLNDVSFMDGWNSEAYQSLRAAHLKKDVGATPCATCAAGG